MTATAASSFRHDLAILLLRLILGIVFMYHGSQKLFGAFGGGGISGTTQFMEKLGLPMPGVQAILAGSAEFFCGLLVLVGLLTRLATIPLIFTMFVAIWTVHRTAFGSQSGGMEYPLTLACIAASITLLGPGRLSIDACRRSRPKPLPASQSGT